MKVSLQDSGPCRKILSVESPADEVRAEYDFIVGEFAKVARVDGFRPGKAPTAVVEKQFSKPIIEETKDRLLPRLYRQALKEKGLSPVAAVDVRDVAFDKTNGINFKVVVDIPPEFKLPKYRKLSLKRKPVEIKDSEVQDAWKRLMDSRARFEDVSGRAVKEGDLVRVDYSGECEGKPLRVLAKDFPGLGEGKDFWVLTNGPEFIPGFSQGLIGLTVESQKDVPVTFPGDYRVPAVAGKAATYKVTVKGLRERVPPTVDAEFLKGFEVDSEQGLRDKLQADLVKAAEQAEDNRLKEEISKFLLEKTECELPQTAVDEETNSIVQGIVRRSLRQGMKQEDLVKQKDEIMNVARRSSTDRVKLAYIIERIAREEKISVDEKEVEDRLKEMAGQYQVPPEKLRAEMEKDQVMEKLKSDIRGEKTMKVLLDIALQSKGWFG